MNITRKFVMIFSAIIALFLAGCTPKEEIIAIAPVEKQSESSVAVAVEFTLQTIAENGKLLYIGVGGEIDGIINPDLIVQQGEVVRIILVNGDGMVHDLFIPDLDQKTEYVRKIGDQAEIIFETGDLQPSSRVYYCTLPGHRKAGQEGNLIVESSK